MPSLPMTLPNESATEAVLSNDTISNQINEMASHLVSRAFSTTILSPRSTVNASAILADDERHHIQILAATTAGVSIVSVMVAMYWFLMMRRNFRRDLILLLILGDFWKSVWYLTYSARMFLLGPVSSKSYLCQATGYFLEEGLESCDFAILFMSLHMYLQIFPPRASCLGADGLYRVRNWVVAAWFLIPNVMAALAYVATNHGYEVTGAFCWLPIRPYWYRLALSWVPRYLIWIFIMAVAVRIYTHVGTEFKVFGYERDRSSTLGMPGMHSSLASADADMFSARRNSNALEEGQDPIEEVAPNDISAPVEKAMQSPQPAPSDSTLPNMLAPARRVSTSNHSSRYSRRASRLSTGVIVEDFATPMEPFEPSMSISRASSHVAANYSPKSDSRKGSSAASSTAQNVAAKGMQLRRRAIQRQLRLLFIYPVVYMLIWIIPFIYHSMNYSDYYAQNPIYALAILNTFCQCFLGFADVAVFCWREKPWRHIPGSNGTFVGSFLFWRFCFRREWINEVRRESRKPTDVPAEDTEEEMEQVGEKQEVPDANEEQPSQKPVRPLLAGFKWRSSQRDSIREVSATEARRYTVHRRHQSWGSDRKNLEAEHAHQRLAMERADYEAGIKAKAEGQNRHSLTPSQPPVSPPATERREWWDVRMAYDLDDDDEHEIDDRVLSERTESE